jgi:(2R)-sulfolactate sulfo-lyase subunit alpha
VDRRRHKFLVHRRGDHVGVATEPIAAGERVVGIHLDDDSATEVLARGDVPLGHKIAIEALPGGARVLKYGVPIGIAPDGLQEGDYVHVHNLKSARW